MTQLFTIILFGFITAQAPATYDDLARAFTAGHYQEVADRTGAAIAANPAVKGPALYLAGLSRQKLGQPQEARAAFAELAAGGEDDPWRYVGLSASSIVQLTEPAGEAGLPFDPVEMANRAVALGATLFEAHYQLGHAYAHRGDYANAAAAFAKSTELPGSLPGAHYYAGIAHYRVKRIDLMAVHFEAFLKLAPDAPERGEVEAIMRTVRGR
jgi:tetratricopeptide (TPR) repeat protein